jgi:hypothetical protein
MADTQNPAPSPQTQSPGGVVDLQRAYYQGEIPREAALASAALVYGFRPAEAERLFPVVAPAQPWRSPWVLATALAGAVTGIVGGSLLVEQLHRQTSTIRDWYSPAMFLGVVGGALIGALAGPLIRNGLIRIWRRHLEVS